jgi:glycerol transport system ATP-binding protein
MTVFNNLAFPLRNRGISEVEVKKRALEVADILDLTPFLNKRASGLTADAKQKISLGRGLVRSDVAAILFDEPLTVIDPYLKWHLRRKLKEIHEQLKKTFIYVTHDQVEAMTFADQVMVMNDGEILQIGTPQNLFENPEHTFVGYFIGSPGMNFIPCTLEGNVAKFNGAQIQIDDNVAARARTTQGKLELGIRPMYLEVHSQSTKGSVPARIKTVEDQGSCKIVTIIVDENILHAKVQEGQAIPENEAWLRFPPQWTKLFADGRLIH